MKVEIQVISQAKLSEMPIFEKVVDRIVEDVLARLAKEGFRGNSVTGLVRPITQEELLVLLPRKKHMKTDGGWLCRTEFVARKNLTNDQSEVTCKLCREILADRATG